MHPSPRRVGFTLVELLVVIAVIALLVGILLPALAGVRRAARDAKCLANIRTVGQGLAMYAGEFRERHPHWSAWHTYGGDGAGDDTPGPGWAEALETYVGGVQAYADPARLRDEILVAYFLQSRYTALLNRGRMYTSLALPQVVFSAQFVLAGDATAPVLFSKPYGDSDKAPNTDPDDARWQATLYPGETPPHQGGSNLVFLDGHAAIHKAADAALTWHGRERRGWADTDPQVP